jgi:hypothetical protein
MRGIRNAYSILVGKLEGKGPPGRLRHRWEDNIKTDLREIGGQCVDYLGEDRDQLRALVNTVITLQHN